MPKHLHHMIEHPRQNLNNAEPLEKVHSLEILSPKGYVLAIIRGNDIDRLYNRADTMAGLLGWRDCEYRQR